MAIIPQFFNDAVVAIGRRSLNGVIAWCATGFVVARENEQGGYNTFLITNRHVFENEKDLLVRFNIQGKLNSVDYDICLLNENNEKIYSVHPNSKVDVACMLINPLVLEQDLGGISAFELNKHSLSKHEMIENEVVEGTIVYSLGFPSGLVGLNSKMPLCRMGCISRISEPSENEEFLLDIQNFPGSSGSPVINRLNSVWLSGTNNYNKTALIGIMAAYLPYEEVLVSKQTGAARQVTQENSGIAIAYSVDAIKETVEIEFNRVKAKETNVEANKVDPIINDEVA